MTQVVLASQSAIRKKLLTEAGLAFDCLSPGVDEDAAKAALLAEDWSPRDIADHLAELKALRVSRKLPGALVIGADTTLDLDGRLFDKAADMGGARVVVAKSHLIKKKTHFFENFPCMSKQSTFIGCFGWGGRSISRS
jgi:septum formation protein